jgi:hypothetical protein
MAVKSGGALRGALATVTDALERLDCSPRGPAHKFTARCPSHDDRGPSLSVAEGIDGRVLVYCHAGCRTEDVVAALGLEMRDLFDGDTGRGLRLAPRIHPRRARRPPPKCDVDTILEAFRAARVPYRCCDELGQWRALCPVCWDPRESVWIVSYDEHPDREGEPALVFCGNDCSADQMARALG